MTTPSTRDDVLFRIMRDQPEKFCVTLIRHRKLRDQFRQIGEAFIYFANTADYLADDLREDNSCPCPICTGQEAPE